MDTWTNEALKEYLVALVADQQHLNEALRAADKVAIDAALHSMDARLATMNEFRQSISDVIQTSLPRSEYDIRHRELEVQISRVSEDLNRQIFALKEDQNKQVTTLKDDSGKRISLLEGEKAGSRAVITWVISIAVILVTVIGAIITAVHYLPVTVKPLTP